MAGGQVRLPAGVVLKPPVSVEDLKTDTEYDPEGAEEFVALIRRFVTKARGPFRSNVFDNACRSGPTRCLA